MSSQYDVDTRFLEFLLGICIMISVFSIVFSTAINSIEIPVIQSKFVKSLYILFLMLFTLFLGLVFGLFIRWYSKYKPSLFILR